MRSTAIAPTEEENSLVAQILHHTKCDQAGFLPADAAVDVFNRSGLSRLQLRDVWGLSDADSNGRLSKEELVVAIRLIGWMQSGKQFSESLANKPGPTPNLEGIVAPKLPVKDPSMSYGPSLPPIVPSEVRKSYRIFQDAGPINGILEGDKVRELFMASNLSYNDLSAIWTLVDSRQRGSLSFREFALGMYFIEALQGCRLTSVPLSIPPQLYEELDKIDHEAKSPFLSPEEASSMINRSYTRSPIPPPKPTPPVESPPINNRSFNRSPAPPVKSPQLPPKPPPIKPKPMSKPWRIIPAQKNEYDRQFATLDIEGTGLVREEDALRYLRKYELPLEELAHVWDLAAIRKDSHLNSDEFAIAMYLIQDRLAGKDIPFELPESLVPPLLRPTVLPFSPQTSPVHSRSFSMKDRGEVIPGSPLVVSPSALGEPSRNRLNRSLTNTSQSPGSESPGPPQSPRSNSPAPRSVAFLTNSPAKRSSGAETPRRRTNTFSAHSSANEEDPLEELRTETKTLRHQVESLLKQLSTQNDGRQLSEQLRQENDRLKAKVSELETSMEAVLTQMQNNDNALSEELNREIERLSSRVAELQQTEHQLQQIAGILEVMKRDNGVLTAQVRDLRSAEATHKSELEDAQHAMEDLERDNTELKTRLSDMTKALSEPDKANSARELRVLLLDVTHENQTLQRRVRETERSMEQLLLSSRDTTQNEELRRENRELKLQVQELEQLTAQLQSTHEDSYFQQVLLVVTRENEGMKARLREMQSSSAQLRTEHDARVAGMQRQLDELTSENHRLKARLEEGNQGSMRRDALDVPPPAYDDESFIPADV